MRAVITLLLTAVCSNIALTKPTSYDPHWFQKNNPGYRDRSGKFYEQSYLPAASLNMAKATNSPNLDQQKAAAILKKLIYQYLDVYVENNGTMNRVDRATLIELVDNEVRALVKDKMAFKRFAQWKGTTDRTINPLTFLFNHPLAIDVKWSDALRKEDWIIENIISINELAKLKKHFGIAPDQLIVFRNDKLKLKPLKILVFPAEQTRIHLWQQNQPNAVKKPTPLNPFWQTQGYVLFTIGIPAAEHRALVNHVRLALIVQ